MNNTVRHFKIYIRKKLGYLGLSYCINCGDEPQKKEMPQVLRDFEKLVIKEGE